MWTKGPDLTSPLITYGPNSHYLILITLYNSYKLSQYRKSNKGNIEEDERIIYDTLGNIVVIELIENEDEPIDLDKELEMMDDEVSSVASPTPFTRS